ncbi:MAG TPA: ATP-dependent DNA helicase RecG [Chitinophagaceae bacterium]|nr:ATP-dependent DNA helicase RecG [Chitinophagaceae bacterium]
MQTIPARINSISSILSNPVEYLKGVGPVRGDMLRKELQIFTFRDLLEHFPYRHIDKTEVKLIRDISYNTDFIQVAGKLTAFHITGTGRGRRLVGELQDKSGVLELTWFQGVNWISKSLEVGREYLVFGKPGFFLGKPQITHPEIELVTPEKAGGKNFLEPIYPTTEKLKARGLNGRNIGKLVFNLFNVITPKDIPENLPADMITEKKLVGRWDAYKNIHFPASVEDQQKAVYRLKFEEFFLAQLRLGMIRSNRHRYSKGIVFNKVGELFNSFYEKYLPFTLTGAQKRVLKEIRQDTARGRQMNRLLQGDVGSGKTIVALMSMLIAADNGYQSCLMAPTEILSQQHYLGISELLKDMPVEIRLLTGSVKAAQRRKILAEVASGEVHILIGTHALIEKDVQFMKLGMAIVDEQHRFGVAQRAKLWEKGEIPPHVLVMTATPIPRTLAMTAYGDLDYSVMDELPPGRLPIKTVHRYEHSRHQVMDFIKSELKKGRQAYIIFPLIEESEKLNYENLMKGYENVKAYFPEPQTYISMVHGKMNADQKDTNMKRFVEHDTQIMVSTTVIEVGVNVPNASVMVIESAEKFGLSQLHQLRGRVGRGAEKSYCILLTGDNISKEARERLGVMCSTNDGFAIAEKDLEIRGPGDIEGTRQSGLMNFKLANIVEDRDILELAKQSSALLLQDDPDLANDKNRVLKEFLAIQQGKTAWSKIS